MIFEIYKSNFIKTLQFCFYARKYETVVEMCIILMSNWSEKSCCLQLYPDLIPMMSHPLHVLTRLYVSLRGGVQFHHVLFAGVARFHHVLSAGAAWFRCVSLPDGVRYPRVSLAGGAGRLLVYPPGGVAFRCVSPAIRGRQRCVSILDGAQVLHACSPGVAGGQYVPSPSAAVAGKISNND